MGSGPPINQKFSANDAKRQVEKLFNSLKELIQIKFSTKAMADTVPIGLQNTTIGRISKKTVRVEFEIGEVNLL